MFMARLAASADMVSSRGRAKGSTFESLPLRKEQTKQKGVENSTPFVFVAYGASLLADIRL